MIGIKMQSGVFVPPEFTDYYEWMTSHRYSDVMKDKNITYIKRIGLIVANSELPTEKIADITTCNGGGRKGLARAVNDYRYFIQETPRKNEIVDMYMKIVNGGCKA